MNKTPGEAWELIESVADNNQYSKTRATSTAKGVFEVTPSESTVLVKSLTDIASMLKEIKEVQQMAPKILTQHPQQTHHSQQIPAKHCDNTKHILKGGEITSKTDGTPINRNNHLSTANLTPLINPKISKARVTNLHIIDNHIT
ncbi:hypothetical protein PIB30_093174 [Stylosanthes scabra]|uniref:Uncharacterized protein n=1 Tax=Stylosanthes scabra TaxID=79078 RepID=A0ABU6RVQ5_9FABA|nr:hypothetical protein [Stylosanthes scabra]